MRAPQACAVTTRNAVWGEESAYFITCASLSQAAYGSVVVCRLQRIRWVRDDRGLKPQRLDLGLQRLVFPHLSLQKRSRQRCLLGRAFGREDIGIAHLVIGGAEVLNLDEPDLDERVKAVVHRPEADAERPGDVALAVSRVGFDASHHAKMHMLPRKGFRLVWHAAAWLGLQKLPHGWVL